MIGDRIKLVRQTIKIDGKKPSQELFGEKLNVTRDAIANIENGRVEQPSDLFIDHLCGKFNVNEVWLRTGEGEMFAPQTLSEEITNFMSDVITDSDDSFRRRFIAMLSKLSPEEWALLAKMAKKMEDD